jgi:cysteine desulfurase
MDGGGHEKGMRSGTLNVPGIAGFGKAADICRQQLDADGERMSRLRNKLENALLQLDATYVNGSQAHRLPHVANLSFNFVNGDQLMMGLNKEIALSSGAACTSASMEPSYVLKALGVEDDLAHSSLRFSIGRYTTEEQIDYVIERVKKTVEQLRTLTQIS